MFHQAFAHFPCQIQAPEAGIFLLQFLDDAQTLAIVLETAVPLHQPVQNLFAVMAEGRMTEVVRQRNGLGQILIEPERTGDATGDGGDFQCVREPRPQMR